MALFRQVRERNEIEHPDSSKGATEQAQLPVEARMTAEKSG